MWSALGEWVGVEGGSDAHRASERGLYAIVGLHTFELQSKLVRGLPHGSMRLRCSLSAQPD